MGPLTELLSKPYQTDGDSTARGRLKEGQVDHKLTMDHEFCFYSSPLFRSLAAHCTYPIPKRAFSLPRPIRQFGAALSIEHSNRRAAVPWSSDPRSMGVVKRCVTCLDNFPNTPLLPHRGWHRSAAERKTLMGILCFSILGKKRPLRIYRCSWDCLPRASWLPTC